MYPIKWPYSFGQKLVLTHGNVDIVWTGVLKEIQGLSSSRPQIKFSKAKLARKQTKLAMINWLEFVLGGRYMDNLITVHTIKGTKLSLFQNVQTTFENQTLNVISHAIRKLRWIPNFSYQYKIGLSDNQTTANRSKTGLVKYFDHYYFLF